MATFFKTKLIKNIGTVPITAFSPISGTNSTVIGLTLSNQTEFAVKANVRLKDDTSVEVHYMKDVIVPANSTIRCVTQGEKLIIQSEYELIVQSDLVDSLDAVISYVDIV